MARPKPGQPEPRPAGPAPDPAAFGARLKEAREEIGLGFLEAARKLKIRPQRLAEYEAGKRMPPIPKLLDIVRILGLDPSTIVPEWFMGWERQKEKPKNPRE